MKQIITVQVQLAQTQLFWTIFEVLIDKAKHAQTGIMYCKISSVVIFVVVFLKNVDSRLTGPAGSELSLNAVITAL